MRPRLLAQVLCAVGLLLVTSSPSTGSDHVRLELHPAKEVASRGVMLPLEVVAQVEPGWHINAHKPTQPYLIPTELHLTLPPGVGAGPIRYPEPQRKAMAFAGGDELLVYAGAVGMSTTLQVPAASADAGMYVAAALRYQACNDTTCLPPASVTADALIPVAAVASPGAPPEGAGATVVGADTRFDRWLLQRGLLLTLLAVALLGLGLNLTPCVYPLISVTIAYFGMSSRSRTELARLAVVYALGIALSFSVLGLVAALSGGLFGAALQKPPVTIGIAGVLVLLALGSFGFYQFRPPAVLMRWAGGSSSGALGALFMGLTMGVVAAPCVGPIVVGLLVFVASRQDPLLGFLFFFALALGMSAPYVALAMAAGLLRNLPRSGAWLVWTERLFGCLLFGLAAYLVAPLLPAPARNYVLPSVAALSGVYLGFIERAGSDHRGFTIFKRTVAIAVLVFAVWYARDAGARPGVAWESVATLAQDEHSNRPLLIDFAAEWCIPCRQMDRTTYAQPEVLREAERFHMVRADITHGDETTSRVVEEHGVLGVPTVLVFSSDGKEQRRLVGYVGPEEMLAVMRKVR
jgi:thioredoxin:protein disulfide reductase